MTDLLRIAILFRLMPGYNEGVVRGLARYARPGKPWLFRFFDNPQDPSVSEFAPQAAICCTVEPVSAAAIRRFRFPMVNVGITELAPEIAPVGNDDLAIGRCAARHLLDRGFTSFGYYCRGASSSSSRREEGFMAELRAGGRSCHRCEGLDIDGWLQSLPKQTGLFAFNDNSAAYLADRCRLLDLPIPEHFAVVGADNTESLCLLSWPALSSVEVAAERIGQIAGQMLDELLAGRAPRPQVVPPIGVVIRRSSDLFAIDDEHVSQALRFIGDHAGDPIRVDDVLKAVPVSRRTLEIRFRTLVGRSPLEEIQRVRLDLAKRYLATTDWPISRVALSSGFNDVKRFSTVFHQHSGMTPTQFRRG